MTLKKAHEILERVKYKPGFFFRLLRPPTNDDSYLFRIEANVVDADDFTKTLPIAFSSRIAMEGLKHMDERYFLSLIRSFISEFEQHETDEFFRFEDKKIFDPHIMEGHP